MPLSPQSRTWLWAISRPAGILADQAGFADVADLAILDRARDFAQHHAVLGAAENAAVRDDEPLDLLGDEKGPAVDRLRLAGKRQPGQADIGGVLDADESAAASVAKHGSARHALNLRSRFQLELGGGVAAGREKERQARPRRRVGRLLQARRLIDAVSRHDAVGADRLLQLVRRRRRRPSAVRPLRRDPSRNR